MVGCVNLPNTFSSSLDFIRTLGANDAVMPGERQYVDISKFAENLHTTISLVTSPTSPYYSPDTRVVLITPPPVYVHQRPGQPWDDRNNVNTKAYADQVIRVGEETGVPVVDVWTKFWEYADGKEEKLKPLLTDGLHLTSDGYSVCHAFPRKTPFLSPILLTRLSQKDCF